VSCLRVFSTLNSIKSWTIFVRGLIELLDLPAETSRSFSTAQEESSLVWIEQLSKSMPPSSFTGTRSSQVYAESLRNLFLAENRRRREGQRE
jgi:hypothetical protein